MNIKKAIAAAALATAGAGAGLLGTAGTADAYVWGDYKSYLDGGVGIRTGPSQGYSLVNRGYYGDGTYLWCYTTGQNIYGNPFWDWNTDAWLYNHGYPSTGYSAEYYLINSQYVTNHC